MKKLTIEEQKNCYDGFKELLPSVIELLEIMVKEKGVEYVFEKVCSKYKGDITTDLEIIFYNAILHIKNNLK